GEKCGYEMMVWREEDGDDGMLRFYRAIDDPHVDGVVCDWNDNRLPRLERVPHVHRSRLFVLGSYEALEDVPHTIWADFRQLGSVLIGADVGIAKSPIFWADEKSPFFFIIENVNYLTAFD
ncbi:hypothetical protein PFISCL1PPCAC_1106, partial [Pristionchus fissidentatus]